MNEQDVIKRWQVSSEQNLKTASDLYKLKHYDWALFIGQLSLEKLLKGLVVKSTHTLPPHIHDLNKLASLGKVKLSKDQIDDFVEITRFHIQARYDDIKYELYKTVTPKYAKVWFSKIKEYHLWLKKLY